MSACSQETVVAFTPRECSGMAGRASQPAEGGRVLAAFDLSAPVARPERFVIDWGRRWHAHLVELDRASCEIRIHHAVFHGVGDAAVDGVRGYTLRFAIVVSDSGAMRVAAHLRRGEEDIDPLIAGTSSDETSVFENGLPIVLHG